MPDSAQLNPSDPHRRTRRHRYQEGPGLLFLATQNGRPGGRPQKPRLDQVRRRMRAVRLAREVGIEAACQQLEVAPRSLYRWRAAFAAQGISGLVDDSRRPHRLRVTVPAWVDMVIVAIRLHTYWNSKRIAAEMSRRRIYRVSPDHIDQLFKACGCSRGTVPRQPGPRYERSRPNELWHVDLKAPFSSTSGALTSRPGLRVWSTTTRGLSLAFAS